MKTALVTLLIVCGARMAAADVRITETTSLTIGGTAGQGSRVTAIKGAFMRIDSAVGSESVSTLYDLPAGTTMRLDPKKKRAEVRAIAARQAQLEREYPRARTTVTFAPTGSTKSIAGASCAEHAFAIRVPMSKDGTLALTMTGRAWLAADAPGAADYAAFAKAAIERDLVLGVASNNKILLAITRGQTELYRAVATAHGMPFQVETNTDVDGHGMLAA